MVDQLAKDVREHQRAYAEICISSDDGTDGPDEDAEEQIPVATQKAPEAAEKERARKAQEAAEKERARKAAHKVRELRQTLFDHQSAQRAKEQSARALALLAMESIRAQATQPVTEDPYMPLEPTSDQDMSGELVHDLPAGTS